MEKQIIILGSNADDYGDGVLMQDGRIFCVPFNAPKARIFDLEDFTSMGTPLDTREQGSYMSGMLMNDGNIFLPPFNAPRAVIYNTVSHRIIETSLKVTSFGAYVSAIQLNDGKIFVLAAGEDTSKIYNPETDTFTETKLKTFGYKNNFIGGALLPDGRVFCIPFNAMRARIYDVKIDFTYVSGILNNDLGYIESLNLPDGNVFLLPNNMTFGKIYNYRSGEIFVTPLNGESAKYIGCSFLPDNKRKIFCLSWKSLDAKIYDWTTNEVIDMNLHYERKTPNDYSVVHKSWLNGSTIYETKYFTLNG